MHDMTESVKKYDILSPAIARLCPAAGSSLSPLIGGSGGASWRGLRPCRSSSESWTTTRRLYLSWTAPRSVKGCFRARERLRTSSSWRRCGKAQGNRFRLPAEARNLPRIQDLRLLEAVFCRARADVSPTEPRPGKRFVKVHKHCWPLL